MRIVFMGTTDFATESLKSLVEKDFNVVGVVTAPDRPAGRGQKIKYSSVKAYALEQGLKILQPEKLKGNSFITDLESLKADLFVVVAFRMLPEVVWAMPSKGTFNLHASLLPNYRGAALLIGLLSMVKKKRVLVPFSSKKILILVISFFKKR